MTSLSMKTVIATLLAGSLALGAGGVAFARTDGAAVDPAKFQQRIEKRVDKALSGTTATAEQKTKVTAPTSRARAPSGSKSASPSRPR